MSDDEQRGVIHLAGPIITANDFMRQRCCWCGALLVEYELSRVAVEIPADGSAPQPPRGWEPGTFVGVDGGMQWHEATVAGSTDIPESCCMNLDPAVTA